MNAACQLRRPRLLSLFTGAGGLDLGFEAAGYETIGCAETSTVCRATLRTNRPDWELLAAADVFDLAAGLKPADLGLAAGELEVVAGGPPCQPFSKASQWASTGRRGMADRRAHTVAAMLAIVEALLPRVLVIENVDGFFRGRSFARHYVDRRLALINDRHGTSYRLSALQVDAADYGVPQHRHRVIAVASRDGARFRLPEPTHAAQPMTAWDAIGDLEGDQGPAGRGNWVDLLPAIPEGGNYQYLTAKGGGQEVFGYRTRYWSFLLKLAKDRPSWTLPASPGPSTGPFHWANRPLSLREQMRLQTFPDSWAVAGGHKECVQQIGNATPPLLAEIVARAVSTQLLGGQADPRQPLLLGSRRPGTPPPVPPIEVPARYVRVLGPKPAHPGVGRGPAARVCS